MPRQRFLRFLRFLRFPRLALLPLGLALLCSGCTASPTAGPQTPADLDPGRLEALQTAGLRIGVEPLGPVPNAGLLLPEVSPDGAWIAALEVGPASESAEPFLDDLFTGRGLASVRLVLMPSDEPSTRQTLVQGGAAWPSWSRNGERLAAVDYDEAGRPRVLVYHRATGEARWLAPGFRAIFSPAFSPDGRRIVFAAQPAQATGARVYLLDLETGATSPAPAAADGVELLFPYWVDDDRLICLALEPGAVSVRGWQVGEQAMRQFAQLPLEVGSPPELFQALAGVPQPLSPDGRHFAYYDAAAQRLAVVDLVTGEHHAMPPGSQAACWVGPGLLAVGTEHELLLTFVPGRAPPRQLTSGRMLPRWGDGHAGQILLLTPGGRAWSFDLLRLHIDPTR